MNTRTYPFTLFFICIFSSFSGISQSSTSGQVRNTRTITTSAPFLLLNGNIQAAGMGEIGVVSSPTYYTAGLTHNPALLSRNKKKFGAQFSYTPWLRAVGIPDISISNLGAHLSLGKKHSIGYHGHIFTVGGEALSPQIGAQASAIHESRHGLRYAISLSEYFSVGVGANYIKSNLFVSSSTGVNSLEAFSGDIGINYQNTIIENSNSKWEFSTGLSIQNMGPKTSYISALPANEFLPTNLQLGFMIGNHMGITDQNKVVIEFAYQISKLLVPSEGNRSDKGALHGMFSSFGDASDVSGKESQEYIHQLGLETRLQANEDLLLAVRAGLFLEHDFLGGRKYSTAGLGLHAFGFQVDIAYIQPLRRNHPLQNTIRFGLSYLIDRQ